jgi:hypothetical protein
MVLPQRVQVIVANWNGCVFEHMYDIHLFYTPLNPFFLEGRHPQLNFCTEFLFLCIFFQARSHDNYREKGGFVSMKKQD